MMTLGEFVGWLQTEVLIPCVVCPAYVTRGDVAWDANAKTWLLRCGYCGSTAVRATHRDPTPMEVKLDA